MKKIPISLRIDDPAPIISVYHEHARSRTTKDGRALIPTFPNSMLFSFCDIIERHGIKGKFSVVPMPGNKGDIVRGLDGVDMKEVNEWLDTAKSRVVPLFTIAPEMLTHHKAVNVATGETIDIKENLWSFSQDRTTLEPYLACALSILKEAGFSVIGVSSPWDFGIEVEEEYVHAISNAVKAVSESDVAWYCLRSLRDEPNAKPWVALEEDDRVVVSIPATTRDVIWQTIDSTDTSEEYVSGIADILITADGKSGDILRVLETGGWPILSTHWQSLASNGLFTGLRVLDEVGRRIRTHLSDRVEWMSFEEIMQVVAADKDAYPKPNF